jgi:hypothetical protein
MCDVLESDEMMMIVELRSLDLDISHESKI